MDSAGSGTLVVDDAVVPTIGSLPVDVAALYVSAWISDPCLNQLGVATSWRFGAALTRSTLRWP